MGTSSPAADDDEEAFRSRETTDRLRLIRREKLAPEQLEAVTRLVEPHVGDFDSLRDWQSSPSRVEVVWNDTRGVPVGILWWCGSEEADVSVWIAEKGLGYARRAAELLAKGLVTERVPKIRYTPVLSAHRVAARRFMLRLREEFAREWAKLLKADRRSRL